MNIVVRKDFEVFMSLALSTAFAVLREEGKGIFVEFITQILENMNPWLIYVLVAVILLGESSAVPITNNIMLLCTGAMASAGYLNIWILGVAAIVGSIAGACVAYIIGERGGRSILYAITRRFRIDDAKIQIAENWFQKSGVWMIFISRMTPYIRPFSCFPAGIARMPFGKFFVAASAGSIIWCIALLTMGWYLGSSWELALSLVQNYALPVVLGLVLIIVAYLSVRYWLQKRLRSHLLTASKPDTEKTETQPQLLRA